MRKGLVLGSLVLLLPLSAFGGSVTLPEVKEAVSYLMDDVSTVREEMKVLKREVLELRKKVFLLEQKLSEKNNSVSTEAPRFFKRKNYRGKLVFAGAFKSFSRALIRTQDLFNLNLSPSVLFLHNGMFSVVLKSGNKKEAISLCSFLKRKRVKCFVGSKDNYSLREFPVADIFKKAEKALSDKKIAEVDGFTFVKTDLLSASPYLYKKVKDGYIALVTGGVL